jgi:hypothetical protein
MTPAKKKEKKEFHLPKSPSIPTKLSQNKGLSIDKYFLEVFLSTFLFYFIIFLKMMSIEIIYQTFKGKLILFDVNKYQLDTYILFIL